MRSVQTKEFRDYFRALPKDVQKLGRNAYKKFAVDPQHPSLQFKCVDPKDPPLYSVRISR